MENIVFTIPQEEDFYPIIEKIVSQKMEQFTQNFASQNNERILNRSQAAKYLNITPPTLDKYTENGTIKGYRLGGRPVYKQSELIESLKEIEVLKYRRG